MSIPAKEPRAFKTARGSGASWCAQLLASPLSARTNESQAAPSKVSRGPAGRLLSRTARPLAEVRATSTQSPFCPEWDDFRNGVTISGFTLPLPALLTVFKDLPDPLGSLVR